MDRKHASADRLTPDSFGSRRRPVEPATGMGDDGSESISEVSLSRGVTAIGGDSPSITSHSRGSSVTSTSAENISASYESKVAFQIIIIIFSA